MKSAASLEDKGSGLHFILFQSCLSYPYLYTYQRLHREFPGASSSSIERCAAEPFHGDPKVDRSEAEGFWGDSILPPLRA